MSNFILQLTKKIFSAVLLISFLLTAFSVPVSADRTSNNVRFLPTVITVSKGQTEVEGYFVNMNTAATVVSFSDFSVDIYKDNNRILRTRINDFNLVINPLSMAEISFTVPKKINLSYGEHFCGENYHARWSGTVSVSY